jgi:hypothetical protein
MNFTPGFISKVSVVPMLILLNFDTSAIASAFALAIWASTFFNYSFTDFVPWAVAVNVNATAKIVNSFFMVFIIK